MPAQPDTIIWGSHIRTLDPHLATCSAVAIKDGLVIATDADKLLDLPVLMTIVDGRIVHEARSR